MEEVAHRFVVVSGIPGCGKSSLAGALARHLGIPHLDKDEILDSLLAEVEGSSEPVRHRLSRAADEQLEARARTCSRAVLDSFWRSPSSDARSGTPSRWLAAAGIRSVEVFCRCPPEIAATRFLERVRHPGHLDSSWTHAALVEQSRRALRGLPLGVGELIEVDTSEPVDLTPLADRVGIALEG